jgi:aspartyl-tRNA(Asn)/glutamyl-tRNA(Gln) amidotransferase subunit A
MIEKTATELSKLLSSGALSSVELTEAYLDRIAKANDNLNIYITICEESALEQAKTADERRAKGFEHPLLGIPLAHKDIFCTDGIATTCGSRMLENFIAPYNATVVEKFENVGAVTLGKTNMDEFAMGSSNETSYFGPVKNPWNVKKSTGRLFRRVCGSCSSRLMRHSHRNRYWWLYPTTGRILRCNRV